MKQINLLKGSIPVLLILALASCQKKESNIGLEPEILTESLMAENGNNPDEASVTELQGLLGSESAKGNNGGQHFLYTESNATGTNEIIGFKILNNGSLLEKWTTASGGAGTGKLLGSQGAVVIDENNKWLYAVNAGSNTVSSFEVKGNGKLTLAHTISTMGMVPVSVTVRGNLLYVLNRGSDAIHGIRIGNNGMLTDIPNSTKALSGSMVDAPQISFTPNGHWIVVTEKATNKIGTFKVNANGTTTAGIFTNSTGATPFGFDYARNDYMIVSNAVGGMANAGSATSYTIGMNGVPHDVNGAIANEQSAPCWVATTMHGRYAYVTNTASNTVSSYYISATGALHLVKKIASATDMGPLDVVVTANNYYVYTLNGAAHTINGFKRTHFGGLEKVTTESGLPAGSTGLATF